MDEAKLAYLLEHKVQLCTSIDGPEHLHDKQRKLPGLSAHKKATYWIKRINDAYQEMGLDPTLYHVEAAALRRLARDAAPVEGGRPTRTQTSGAAPSSCARWTPSASPTARRPRVEYPRAEYLEFYRNATDYILELNKRGVEILERFAAIFLTKILGGEDPNFLDIRSPCGAGIGQVAYNY